MKIRTLFPAVALAAPLFAGAAEAPDAVFFGRVDAATVAPQDLLHRQPVVARPPAVTRVPVVLHVRPGEAERWAAHCEGYGACALPVLFVNEGAYRERVLARVAPQDDREQAYRDGQRRHRLDREARRLCDDEAH